MDGAACNVVYVDRAVKEDGVLNTSHFGVDGAATPSWVSGPIRETLSLLIDAFGEGMAPMGSRPRDIHCG